MGEIRVCCACGEPIQSSNFSMKMVGFTKLFFHTRCDLENANVVVE